MGYYRKNTYKTSGELRAKADRKLKALRKKDPSIAPVLIEGNKIARSWWAKAWNRNLEGYADYENRIARGRRYVKNGAVVDLKIEKGLVRALVMGSRGKPYAVLIRIDPLDKANWAAILGHSSKRIDSLESLVRGEFPRELEELFTLRGKGLFPGPAEIHFNCDCPDWADMCKHVAAVLYGIGARFDEDPTLFFLLRDIEFGDLIRKSLEQTLDNLLENADRKSKRTIVEDEIWELFDVEEG